VLDMLESGDELRHRLRANTEHFRTRMAELDFDILPGNHPIAPIMYGDAALAGRTADAMLERGIYVIAFSFPVVPRGQARIRTQMSAAHSTEDIDRAVDAFVEVRTAIAGD
jgi:glycine C-acetyltransferase